MEVFRTTMMRVGCSATETLVNRGYAVKGLPASWAIPFLLFRRLIVCCTNSIMGTVGPLLDAAEMKDMETSIAAPNAVIRLDWAVTDHTLVRTGHQLLR
jgi:hypothetical protein